MLALFTSVVVFLATFLATLIAVAVAWMILDRASPADQAGQAEGTTGSDGPLLLRNEALSTLSIWARLLAHFDFTQRMKARIAEAGLNWSVGRVTAMMLLSGSVGLVAATKVGWLPSWIGMAGGCLAGMLPYTYVLRRRATRLARFEEQFPDALEFLARALRAGHPFAVSLEMLANESPTPMSVEMRKVYDERQLGMSWDQALENLARRVSLVDVGFFAAAVQLQSRTGGKLGEVLARLAETMRERFALRGEIRAISAHGRLTGLVLTLIPLVVMVVMTLVNPSYMAILISHPRGKDLILAALVCLTLAHFLIRRIVNIRL